MEKQSCKNLGTVKQEKELDDILVQAKKYNWSIIKVLQHTQKIYGYLPKSVIMEISQKLNRAESEIYSVITFYAEFSLTPKGKYPISVCLGTACYVNGAGLIYEKICSQLGITEGETTLDGKFSIDQTRCIGCCGMAPVMSVGEDVYGNVKLDQVDAILKKYMEK